ncbi:hypothetical protein Rin_00010570, partial [Candidatus Regiella insecticola 5.15]
MLNELTSKWPLFLIKIFFNLWSIHNNALKTRNGGMAGA